MPVAELDLLEGLWTLAPTDGYYLRSLRLRHRGEQGERGERRDRMCCAHRRGSPLIWKYIHTRSRTCCLSTGRPQVATVGREAERRKDGGVSRPERNASRPDASRFPASRHQPRAVEGFDSRRP